MPPVTGTRAQRRMEGAMGEHLQEYLRVLEVDQELREGLRTDPAETLNSARLSKEEKDALKSGDLNRVSREAGGVEIAPEVGEAIKEMATRLKKA